MDGLDGVWIKERLVKAGEVEVMLQVGAGFVVRKGWQVEFQGDSLIKGLVNGSEEPFSEMGLSDEDNEGGVGGVHIEVGDNLKFIEVFVFKQMGFIKEDDGDLFMVSHIVMDTVLY